VDPAEVDPTQVEVRAGGGVVLRHVRADAWEVVLVHRPKYDDWSLPKGKVDPGETVEEAALREVEEETGLVCRLLQPCGEVIYRDAKGRLKVVWYWVMEVVLAESFTPSREVDSTRWVTVTEALGLLTYERDRDVLAAATPDA